MIEEGLEKSGERLLPLLREGAALCLLGIGGVSMHALAILCRRRGIRVFGADREQSAHTRRLVREGTAVFVPHAGEEIKRAAAVVCSLAIGEDDADLALARAAGIPVFSRGALLGALMKDYGASIAVSGSHGKSTVTAMLCELLCAAGRDPTVLSGAALCGSEESLRIGGREYLVAEACEYGDSFLSLRPSLSLFLNLEWDHPDYFESEEALVRSFARASMGSGAVLYNADSPLLSRAISLYGQKHTVSVGRGADADYRYAVEEMEEGCATLLFWPPHRPPVRVRLSVIGRFQAENAAMALAAADLLGVPMLLAKEALSRFSGIARRLCPIGLLGKTAVYYDYAHHPTEIRAGLRSLREKCGGPLGVFFRPHTYSRTEALFDGFAAALREADEVFVTEIDGARESAGSVSAEALALAAGGRYLPLERAKAVLSSFGGAALALMGAGDLSSVKEALFSSEKKC